MVASYYTACILSYAVIIAIYVDVYFLQLSLFLDRNNLALPTELLILFLKNR